MRPKFDLHLLHSTATSAPVVRRYPAPSFTKTGAKILTVRVEVNVIEMSSFRHDRDDKF